jgi:DNA replication protein DnaC
MFIAACAFFQMHRSVEHIKGHDLSREIVECTRPDGPGGIDVLIRQLTRVKVLCIDEVDKMRLSPRVEDEFFNLLSNRIDYGRTMIFTAQRGLDHFVSRFSEVNRGAVERRMREFFVPIFFEKEG